MRPILLVIIIFICLNSCHRSGNKRILPILGNRDTVTKMVDGKQVVDTIYNTIPAFKFINQYGNTITDKNLDGKIYVADFFFTSCPSICPGMQRNMLTVYKEFKADTNFKILSYTIDPKHDTVPVLKNYADKLGIAGNSWWLLLGQKEVVYNLAHDHYLVKVNEGKDGLIHEGWFVLIDKQKRMRGAYDGTDVKQVNQLIADIKTLKQE